MDLAFRFWLGNITNFIFLLWINATTNFHNYNKPLVKVIATKAIYNFNLIIFYMKVESMSELVHWYMFSFSAQS